MHVIVAPNALQAQNEHLRRENGALHDEIERLRRELSVAHTENEGLRVGRVPTAALPASPDEVRTGAAVTAHAPPSEAEIPVAARAIASARPAEDPIPVARRMAPGEVLGAMGRPYAAPAQVIHASSSVRSHARPTIFVSAIGGGRNPTGPMVQTLAPANGPTVQMMAPPSGQGAGARPLSMPVAPVAPVAPVGGGAGPRVYLMAADGTPGAARTAMPAPPSGPQTVVGVPRGGTWPAVQMLPAGAARQGSGWPTVAVADIAPRRELAAPVVQAPAVGPLVAATQASVQPAAATAPMAPGREVARPIMQLTAANVLPEEIDQALALQGAPPMPSRAADIAAQHAPAITVQAVASTPSRAVAVARPAASRVATPPTMQLSAADVLPDGILLAQVQQPIPPSRRLPPAEGSARDTPVAAAIALPAASEPLDDAATRFAMLELD